MESDFELKVLELPAGEDPDGFLRKAGAEAYREQVSKAPAFVEHIVSRACAERDLSSPEAKARAVGEILPRLTGLQNRVLVASALARIADRLDLNEADVRAEYRRVMPALRRGEEAPARRRQRPSRSSSLAERQLIHLLLAHAGVRRDFATVAREEELQDLATGPIMVAVLNQERAGHPVNVESLKTLLASEERARMLEAVLDDFPGLVAGDWEEAWRVLRKENLEKESRILQRQLASAEAMDVDALLRRKLEVRREIEALS
jgi:DNA primase